MNANMKSNDWILCPSKRFPGKFYYFNVTNGETAWSMHEAESLSLKKNNTMPEQVYNMSAMSSPAECPFRYTEKYIESNRFNDTTNVFKPIIEPHYQNAVFGQAIFPKPLQNHVKWTPPDIKTEGKERKIFIQNTGEMLGRRIVNFEEPLLRFDEKNEIDMTRNNIPNYITVPNNMAMASKMSKPNNMTMSNNMTIPNNMVIPNSMVIPYYDNMTMNMPNTIMVMAENKTIPNNITLSNNMITQNKMAMQNNIAIPNNMAMPNNMTMPNNLAMPNNIAMTNNMAMPNNIAIPDIMTMPNKMTMPNDIAMPNNMTIPNNIVIPNSMSTPNNMALPNNFIMGNNMTLSNNMSLPNNMAVSHNSTTMQNNMAMSNNLFGTLAPNKYVPSFQNDECSIDSMGMSKMNLNKKFTRKPILSKPILNFTQNKQNHIESKTNLFLNFHENTCESIFQTENPFKKPNAFVKQNEHYPNCQQTPTDGVKKSSQFVVIIDNEKPDENQRNIKDNTTQVISSRKNTSELANVIATQQNKSLKVGNVVNTTQRETEKLTVSPCDKKENTLKHDKNLKKFNEGDLRLILIAKRRKPVDIDKSDSLQGKKIKTSKIEDPPKIIKKKVSFNLEPEDLEKNKTEFTYCDEEIVSDKFGDAKKDSQKKESYIVVDTNVLLDSFDFMDSFLKMDPKCRLIIPYKVMSEVLTLSKGKSSESHTVTIARYRVRRLSIKQDNVIVKKSHQENVTVEDDIISCCLESMKENSDVILLTNNEKLQSKAKLWNIKALTYQEFKEGCIKNPKVNFDIENIKISVQNKPEKGIHAFRSKLFEDKSNMNSTEYDNISSEENSMMFQIQNGEENLTSTPKNQKQTDENISPYSQRALKIGNEINESKTVSLYFHNEGNENAESINKLNRKPRSIFDEQNTSIFEIEKEKSREPVLNFEINLNGESPEGHKKRVSLSDTEQMLSTENNTIDNVEKIKENAKMLEERIESRQEEFLCHFRQVMEECLTFVLSNSSIENDIKLWNLYESLQCVAYMYGEYTAINKLATFLIQNLYDHNGSTEKFRKNIKANDVFKIISNGLQLIKKIQDKTHSPLSTVTLIESQLILTELLNLIQDPTSDVHIEPIKSVCRSELSPDNYGQRRNFIKDKSEILNYLKKHYPVWADYDKIDTQTQNSVYNFHDMKILRTCGKNLSSLKINKSFMTLNSPANDQHNDDNLNDNHNYDTQDDNNNKTKQRSQCAITQKLKNPFAKPKDDKYKDFNLSFGVKNTENVLNSETRENETENPENSQAEPKIIRLFTNKTLDEILKSKSADDRRMDFDKNDKICEDSSQNQNLTKENEPTILKNVELIKKYEDKIKVPLDLEKLNYSMTSLSCDSDDDTGDCPLRIDEDVIFLANANRNDTEIITENNDIKNDIKTEPHDENASAATNTQSYAMSLDTVVVNTIDNDNKLKDKNDKIDKKYENYRFQAFSILKSFMFGLLNTFKLLNDFIIQSNKDMNDDKTNDIKKPLIHKKSCECYTLILKIIENLKSIIQRESLENTSLKTILEAKDSLQKSINYRETVKQCLRQAQMYENALKTIMVKTEKKIDS